MSCARSRRVSCFPRRRTRSSASTASSPPSAPRTCRCQRYGKTLEDCCLGGGMAELTSMIQTYCLCEDDAVLGTPFYIMEFLDGRIIEDTAMPGIPPENRRDLWKAAIQTLAKFHSVDFRAAGLSTFGQSSGFYDRQLATWKQICTVSGSPHYTRDSRTKVQLAKRRKPTGTIQSRGRGDKATSRPDPAL